MSEGKPTKKVDEDWKDDVEAERHAAPRKGEAQAEAHPVNFMLLLSTMGLQTWAALGEIDAPGREKKEVNLPQASFMIELMAIIQDKTKGNLSKEEEEGLTGLLYQLRMKYVEIAGVQAQSGDKSK